MKKSIKKNIAMLLAGIMFITGICGCTYGFPEDFDKEEVITAAEEVIAVVNEYDYEGLVALIREDLQDNVTAEEFKEEWDEALKELGEFESFGTPVLSGETDMNTGDDFALVAYRCYYAEGKATFTVYFDSNMEMTAIYLKID